MRVALVCPFPAGSRSGNRITAVRWRSLLVALGHRVRVTTGTPRAGYDVLVALHAYREAEVVRLSRATHPERPIVVVLTGTDLYHDLSRRAAARRSLEIADLVVVLHDRAASDLPRALRAKVRVIRQSAEPVRPAPPRSRATFDVALVAHLRREKDPLRAAYAARQVPAGSRLRIVHAGCALEPRWRRLAEAEQSRNPRYRWLGEVAPARARRLVASCRVMVLTSLSEGGANVLGEAIVAGTPVLAARIPAALSALGPGYAGFFRPGDTAGLARLFSRAERDARFLATLTRQTRARRSLFSAAAEKRALRALLAEVRARA